MRKGNPIARLIAMWIAFIMLLTPLYQHSGLNNDTKAQTGTIEYNIDVNLGTIVDGGVKVVKGVDDKYSVQTVAGKNMYFFSPSETSVSVTSSITGDLVCGDGTVNAPISYQYAVMMYSSEVQVTQTVADNATGLKVGPNIAAVSMSDDTVYAVYIKISNFSYTDSSNVTQNAASNGTWTLLTTYTLKRETALLSGGTSPWVTSSNSSTTKTLSITSNTRETEVEAAGNLYIGDIKMYYDAYNGSYDISDHVSSATEVLLGTDLTATLSDGSYIAYPAYSTDDEALTYEPSGKGTYVTLDKTGPVVDDPVWTHIGRNFDPWGYVSADTTDGVYYLDVSNGKKYTLDFRLIDANPTEKVDIKFYEIGGSSTNPSYTVSVDKQGTASDSKQQYLISSFLPDGIECGKTYEVRVALVDKLGNDGGEDVLVKVCPIDPTLKATYTITDLNNNQDADNKLDTPTKLQSKISGTVTSGNTLTSLSIFEDKDNDNVQDDDEIAFVNKENLTGANMSSGLYTYNFNYTIPAEAYEGNYTNVKLVVTDSATSKIYKISGDNGFIYDHTSPLITLKEGVGIYKWDGSSWQPIPSGQISNGDYNLDTTKTDKYKIVVDVKEELSGIKSVTAYYNDKSNARVDIGALNIDNTITTDNVCYSSTELSISQLKGYIDNTTDGRLAIFVEAIDNVDLDGIVWASPVLAIPDMDLKIDSVTLTVGGNDTPINIREASSRDFDNKQLFKLTITASSGYPINKIEVVEDVDETDNDTINTTGTDVLTPITGIESECTQDSITKRYSITKEIYVPNSIDPNTLSLLLNDVYVRAHDNHTVDVSDPTDYNVLAEELGNLLYDSTLPVITDASTGLAFAQDTSWHQALEGKSFIEIDAKITTGPQSVATESTFEDGKITYTVTNSKVNDITTPTADGVTINTTDTPARVSATAKVEVPESLNANGTTITFNAVDKAGNATSAAVTKIVDATNPRITGLKIVGYDENNPAPVYKNVKISADAWDNLAIDKVVVEVQQTDGTTYYSKTFDDDAINQASTYITKNVVFEVTLPDGSYKATVKGYDKAGYESNVKETTFIVDSTAPVVDVDITAGTAGKTNYFYSSNVTLTFTKSDKNSVNEYITDNGTDITNKVVWGPNGGTYTVTEDGLHTIQISAKDDTGNPAITKSVSFIKDTVDPTVSATINGGIVYNDSLGVVVLTSNATTAFTVSDANEDVNDFNYQIIKAVPDEAVETGTYLKSALRSFTFADEAEYTINAFSVDMANRQGPTKTVRFRIDKTAPSISIGGIASGGTSSSAVTVSLNMQELYWKDASGTVEVYLKSGEGFGEELVDEITYTPTGRNTAISRTFTESGIYRIEFNARDSAGHTATTSSTFTIDTEAPVVTLEGVSNYDVTDKDVVIASTITDKFYASKRVTITGTVTDETGKVTPLTIDNYSATANPTTINETFSADGIYDLTINCVDVAGNSDSKSVHFTIDKTDPVIGDLSDIDGKVLTAFEWNKDLDELVSDLTVCDVHMYLNGKEYNGEDAVADGSYVLLITAEDELGHVVEKSVEFVLDTKEPVFIVTGVEDGEKKLEPYNITVSLQLEEDTLTSVTLNGEVVTINGNTATIDVTEVGEYKLYMEAVDEAGNVSSAEYEFELEAEKDFNIWIIIGIIALILLIIIFIIAKKKKDKDK